MDYRNLLTLMGKVFDIVIVFRGFLPPADYQGKNAMFYVESTALLA